MYLRMKMNKWQDLQADIGVVKVPIKLNRSVGFLEVYDTLIQLEKDYPLGRPYKEDVDYVQIEEIPKID